MMSNVMRDLTSKGLIVAKGLTFLGLALAAGALLLMEAPSLRAALLLALVVWSSCRFYYFLFYVLHTYVDPSLRYAGLTALIAGIWRGTRHGDAMSAELESRIREAETRIFAAIKGRDVAALEHELADDFVHASLDGEAHGRAAFLRAIAETPYRILELDGENLRFRLLGDVALLAGVQRARVELPEGGVVTGRTGFVDGFAQVDGRWLLRHAVSVELPSASEA